MKGITQNIIPYSDGWAVFEDWRPDTLRFFNDQEEAMYYARTKSHFCETPVLLHSALPYKAEKVTLLVMSGSVLPIVDKGAP